MDDLQFVKMILRDALEGAGFQVIGDASTGREAIEQYEKLRPDLVFMDITMPEMDGLEAIQRILADFPEARIIVCSAMGQENIIEEAIFAGAVDFIIKPFEEERVVNAARIALDK